MMAPTTTRAIKTRDPREETTAFPVAEPINPSSSLSAPEGRASALALDDDDDERMPAS